MIVSNDNRYVKDRDISLRGGRGGATMTVMGYVIRPVQSAMELAEVFDVMGAELAPARTIAELARVFPERRVLMLLAEDDDRIVGGAYVGPRGNMAIALVPQARGQGLGTRLAQRLEEGAIWLGLPAIDAGAVTDRTRNFYLRLGYHGQGSTMRKELPASGVRRTPFDWRYDLRSLRARRQQRGAAVARLRSAG
jgi:GNAT superfamily N-acetyltransferase